MSSSISSIAAEQEANSQVIIKRATERKGHTVVKLFVLDLLLLDLHLRLQQIRIKQIAAQLQPNQVNA